MPVCFKGADEIIPIYLELPDEMVFGEMVFDFATHYGQCPKEVARTIDIYDYYEFLAHRNRRREIEEWYVKNKNQ